MNIIKKILKSVGIIIAAAILMYIYSVNIEPNMLIVKKHDIEISKINENDKIKVVQFTDTQLGDFYSINQLKRAVDKINEQNPDIVLFTGDLIDKASEYEEIEKIVPILSEINAKLGKFAIWGNHDYGSGGHKYYKDIMNKSGFKVLVNEVVKIPISDKKNITISGLDEVMFGNPTPELIINEIRPDDINILILHEPDIIDDFEGSNIDLALAGHSHGGQVAIPFVGAIVKPPFGEKYSRGFYDIDKNIKLYVNTGLGNTRLPFRFMNIPQISVFDI